MLTRNRSSSLAVTQAYADRLPIVRIHHHLLEHLEVGLLAKHLHSRARSVEDVINLTTTSDSSCSWHKY
jgi:hypothetical protein